MLQVQQLTKEEKTKLYLKMKKEKLIEMLINQEDLIGAQISHITYSATEYKTPHRCPVCGGNGQVPNGFYRQTSGNWSSTSTIPEICRSCNGTGLVWNS